MRVHYSRNHSSVMRAAKDRDSNSTINAVCAPVLWHTGDPAAHSYTPDSR